MSQVLKHYFGVNIQTVYDFFLNLFPESNMDDIPDCHLLKQTFIVCTVTPPVFAITYSSLSMRQLLKQFIQSELLAAGSSFKTSNNVLLYGYRLNSRQLENSYPNALHNHFLSETWNALLAKYGEQVISFILSNCCVFKKCSNTSSLLQIAGQALSKQSILPAPSFADGSRCKCLNRLSLMYGHPAITYKSQICRLPRVHVLNSQTTEDLSNRVFPFKTSSWQRKRLVGLLTELQIRQNKCPFTALRDYYANPESNDPIPNYRMIAFFKTVLRRVLPQNVAKCRPFMIHIYKRKQHGKIVH